MSVSGLAGGRHKHRRRPFLSHGVSTAVSRCVCRCRCAVLVKHGIPTASNSVLSRELPGDVISQFRAVTCSVHRTVTAVTGCYCDVDCAKCVSWRWYVRCRLYRGTCLQCPMLNAAAGGTDRRASPYSCGRTTGRPLCFLRSALRSLQDRPAFCSCLSGHAVPTVLSAENNIIRIMTPPLLVLTDRRLEAARCHQLQCRRTLWTALQTTRSTETSVPGRTEDVDSEVKTAELQENISIEGRSGTLRMFIQRVGVRVENIKRGARNKLLATTILMQYQYSYMFRPR
jgi:hypothetical protein